MRQLRAATVALAMLPITASAQQPNADARFLQEIEPLLRAAACLSPTDTGVIVLLATRMSAARIWIYGPESQDSARIDGLIAATEALTRAAVARDPHAECFAAGRAVERMLPR